MTTSDALGGSGLSPVNDITPSAISEAAAKLHSLLPGSDSAARVAGGSPPLMPDSVQEPLSAGAFTGRDFNMPGLGGDDVGMHAILSAARRVAATIPGTSAGQPAASSPGAIRTGLPEQFGLPLSAAQPYPTEQTVSDPCQPSAASVPSTDPERLRVFVNGVRHARYAHNGGLCTEDAPRRSLQRQFDRGPALNGGSRPFNVDVVRRDFPVLNQQIHGKSLAWLDNAATTQKPQIVIDALSRFYTHDNSNIHRGAHTLAARSTDAYEQARKKVQEFLGASKPEEIVFVRGTTEGINLIANSYGRKFLQQGDEIVLSHLEHHANIVPWQMVAREKGAVLRVIPVNDRGEIILEEYQRMLGPRTRIVALTHASNSLGTILPVDDMAQMAKRYNARILIDGARRSHLPVNVQQLGADFFVFSGHKIFGPTGIGAVYAREELLDIMPPWQGGGSMIKDVTFEETTYSKPPAKFEAGTPNIADAIGLGVALDYVQQLGLSNIATYEHELLEYATGELQRIDGLRMIGTAREKVSVLSFVLRERPTEEVGRALDQEGIAVRAGHHCSQPALRRFGVESTVRPSLSIYNTFEEIDRLADAIKRMMRR